jgi:hypothetical protein
MTHAAHREETHDILLTSANLAHQSSHISAGKGPSKHAWPEALDLNVCLLDQLGHASSINGQAIIDQDERSVGAGKGIGADLCTRQASVNKHSCMLLRQIVHMCRPHTHE